MIHVHYRLADRPLIIFMEDIMAYESKLETIPFGTLGLIPLRSCSKLGKKVDDYLVKWRNDRDSIHASTIHYNNYYKDSYIIKAKEPRFGSGEGKGVIEESVRGYDLYIMVDVCNYEETYTMRGIENHMSPDDHFQDLKRIIAAVEGKARRINVIMPFLYESRQDKRTSRESLDCAMALQELTRMGIANILTFDAHDPRVQNAIPFEGFESIPCVYQFIKALVRVEPDIQLDSDHLMTISPDVGGMGRAVQLANYLGVDMGMFYKRRDYTQIIEGKNPIVAHEFLGSNVEGKDVFIIDDMISSGDSILDVARELKRRKARRVFAAATFGLFTDGLDKFDKAYDQGIIDRIFTTNLIYQRPELLSRPYYVDVDLSKYIALLIDHLNHNTSLHDLLIPTDRINRLLDRHRNP